MSMLECLTMDQHHPEEYDSELYSDIKEYLGEFQLPNFNKDTSKISGNRLISQQVSRRSSISDAITVFRKKNLSELKSNSINSLYYNDCSNSESNNNKSLSPKNIYEHNLEIPELDSLDSTKSKNSCGRCRQLKRRCSRDLPECLSCQSSDKLCIYIPRKGSKGKRDSVASVQSASASSSSPVPTSLVKRRRYSSVNVPASSYTRSRSNSNESMKSLPEETKRKGSSTSIKSFHSAQSSHGLPQQESANVFSHTSVRLPSIECLLKNIPQSTGLQPKLNASMKEEDKDEAKRD